MTKATAIARDFPWNVVRIEPDKIALLEYDDFDNEHFPALRRSLLVDLESRESKVRDFSTSPNPPILHRKELLLPTEDPRRAKFAALTAALDALGMFADSHKIGLRKAWQQRLEGAGIVIRNHQIVPKQTVDPEPGPAVRVNRHKTAIPRHRLSSPMQLLARHGFIDQYPNVFDYGCGQGDDIRVLSEVGISAVGWDPHFRPEEAKRPADLVNLGFVLNVIENVDERVRVLQDAWSLCQRVMAVAVMVEGHYSVEGLKPFADGYLTSRGTFQKYFSPHELRNFVRHTLDTGPVAVAPGIVFVFRDPEAEQEFLFRRRSRPVPSELLISRALRRPHQPLPERLRPVLDQLWARAVELGRGPETDELAEIADKLARSNVSIARAMGWCRSLFDEAQLESGARRRRDDLLVHFALGAFSGSRAFNTLPLTLRRDVRHFFGNFGAAQSEARRFLFSLGADGTVQEACDSAVQAGLIHSWGDGRYHLDARQTEELPAALRTFVGCASVLMGDAEDANLVTLNVPKRSVAFYFSPDFGAPLTLFTRVTTVYLRDQHVHDQVLSDDKRLLFLQCSLYEPDSAKRRKRSSVEVRIKSILGKAGETLLTARYGDVAAGLRQH
ncbi:DNA phosphorothioation-associated putative methyltransferase [Bradyrhizobium sp. Ec3.3]|uniref:DNA phosphorothioation-associated putative methyltransferase n=1 Tax=Bradyrhizobium sp. Ec3.3 TaxID=189753 RepID=UPI000687F572|nr:DNA phosphorothioation-associated putative methyltransferase [Bradyrhizobium sp. Ec3.3]